MAESLERRHPWRTAQGYGTEPYTLRAGSGMLYALSLHAPCDRRAIGSHSRGCTYLRRVYRIIRYRKRTIPPCEWQPLAESASCVPLADFHAHVIPDSGDELKPRFIRYLYPYALAMIAGVSVPHVRCDTFYP